MSWLICLILGHDWHELYDPDDIFKNKKMCTRCIKFKSKLTERK